MCIKLVHGKHVARHTSRCIASTGCLHKSGQGLNVLTCLEEYLGLLFGLSCKNINRLMRATVCVYERKQSSIGTLHINDALGCGFESQRTR